LARIFFRKRGRKFLNSCKKVFGKPVPHSIQLMTDRLRTGKTTAEARAICNLVSNIAREARFDPNGSRIYGSKGEWEYAGKGPKKGALKQEEVEGKPYFEIEHYLRHIETKKGIFIRFFNGPDMRKSAEPGMQILNIKAHIPKEISGNEARLIVDQFIRSLDDRLTQEKYAKPPELVFQK